ncbi:PTS sugar transporter subunit IIA [Lactobacillus sp. ESL0679]|uniref:PTS sugar transporter subunit IIA n=1 Tax=Lactobacillus sp. ESL0679 TaxID=2983209 RepID=UPI0023F7BB28|nr:PTS sugar transporter subunit IIA [Lactobacillus sp. ESL0679]MDF7682784.1 PTS sugar transporter subunit IIA [Lactobacillus sp. ESL0679]
MEIILASHSNLAKGMYDSVSLIMGKQKNLHYLTAYVNDGIDFKDQLIQEIEPIKDNLILFVTDIIGGSVNTTIAQVVAQNEKYFLISGMNLPLVLELINGISGLDDSNSSEIKTKLQEIVKLGISGLKLVELNNNENEEDTF